MVGTLREVLFRIKCVLFSVLNSFLSLFPRDKRVVMFSSWNGQKYSDSPMYLFEYAEKNKAFKVVWYTKNKELYKKLRCSGKEVAYGWSPKAIFYHLRAKLFVSALLFDDFLPVFMGGSILFDLDHGIPNKFVFFKQNDHTAHWIKYQNLVRKKVEVYLLATNYRLMNVYKECYHIDESHIAFGNKPRTDVLFSEPLRKGINLSIEKLKDGKKAIVYMPTHRSDGRVPLNCHDVLDLRAIQELCEKRDCVFLIKKHYYHRNEVEDFSCYSRIFDITNFEVEPEVLLYQTDILISDYSSVYIDYLLLNRPIILYIFDQELFLSQERDLYVKLEDNDAGFKVKDRTDLTNILYKVSTNWMDEEHNTGRLSLREKYFDTKIISGGACSNSEKIMAALLNETFSINWTSL